VRPVVLDFESYYGDDYTLSKMTTESYIRDPRFEAHGAAIKWDKNTSAQWYDQRELAYILKEEDWSDVYLIAHHCQFDALILSHHYGVLPGMYGCTLSMARLLLGNHLSVSLATLAKYFDLAPKTIDYFSFKGKHWNELTAAQQEAVADGCRRDVEITWELFGRLLRGETGH
jgi:3'-5' exonuclease